MVEPINNRRNFTGRVSDVAEGILRLSLDNNQLVELPLRDVEKARLKYEFNK
jgi:ribosome maturation factor RimP